MSEDRQKLLHMVEKMPTFSQSVVRILEITADIDSAPKELVRLVEHDPILTMKVLKLVNSAYFGLSHKVSSVKQAVVYVGVNTIKHLAVSIAAIGALPRSNAAGFDMDEFWSHALVTAAVAKLLAQQRGISRGDTTRYFIAGLLHDVGQVVLSQFRPAEYREVLAQCRESAGYLAVLEQGALGITHAEVGAVLAEHWKLPPEFVGAIRNHHDPAALATGEELEKTIFVANQVAKLQVDEPRRLSAVEPLPEALEQWLGMSIAEVPARLPGLAQEIESARLFVQLPLGSGA